MTLSDTSYNHNEFLERRRSLEVPDLSSTPSASPNLPPPRISPLPTISTIGTSPTCVSGRTANSPTIPCVPNLDKDNTDQKSTSTLQNTEIRGSLPTFKKSLSLTLPYLPSMTRRARPGAKSAKTGTTNQTFSEASDSTCSSSSSYDKDAKIKALENELSLVKCHLKQERIMAHIEIDQLQRQNSIAKRRIAKFKTDLEDRIAMEEYAKLIQEMAPVTAVGSSYLSKIQAQLCKSLHNQAVLEGQIEAVKREYNAAIENVTNQLAEVILERDEMEEDLLIQVQMVEDEKKEQARLHQERMASRVETIKAFEESWHIKNKPASSSSTSNDIDEKVVGIAYRLEKDQLDRERVEDALRHKLECKSSAARTLELKVKSQEKRIEALSKEVKERRLREIHREAKKIKQRDASCATVVTDASGAFRSSPSNSSRSVYSQSSRSMASTTRTTPTPSRPGSEPRKDYLQSHRRARSDASFVYQSAHRSVLPYRNSSLK